jgi:F-box/leucine-rich repeat protein 10/11
LEISDTELATRVVPPRIFRELDWVENFWPANKKGKGHQYPKVQLYCLMGVERAWTVRNLQLWYIDEIESILGYRIGMLILPVPRFITIFCKARKSVHIMADAAVFSN